MVGMLQHPFFQNALVAGILAAMMCSMVGVYVVLRRVVFVGITLAQLSSAGVALALLLHLPPTLLALGLTLVGVAFFSQIPAQRRIPYRGGHWRQLHPGCSVGNHLPGEKSCGRGAGLAGLVW